MLIWRKIGRLAVPSGDEERVHVERWIVERHGEGLGIVDEHAELLQGFPHNGLHRQLATFDVASDEVPTVGVPLPRRMAMRKQDESFPHEYSDGNRGPNDHLATL